VHADVEMCANASVFISRAMLSEHQAGSACQLRQPVGSRWAAARSVVRQLERAASGAAGRWNRRVRCTAVAADGRPGRGREATHVAWREDRQRRDRGPEPASWRALGSIPGCRPPPLGMRPPFAPRPRSTRDTVDCETPARRASSRCDHRKARPTWRISRPSSAARSLAKSDRARLAGTGGVCAAPRIGRLSRVENPVIASGTGRGSDARW